jgi:hypothetical protein
MSSTAGRPADNDTSSGPPTAHDYAAAQLPRIESLIGADPGVFAFACDAFLEEQTEASEPDRALRSIPQKTGVVS